MNVEAIKAAYRRALGAFETIKIRRYIGAGPGRPVIEVDVLARVTGFSPDEMVAGIQQGIRKAIVLADDLAGAGFDLPITNQDFAVVQGNEHAILVPDDSTRRVGGATIAYELQIVG